MACCGDVPTLETLAAVDVLRRELPSLRVRVVNVVDLMRLQPDTEHPHGLSDGEFDTLFTTDKPVVFAFHGYPWLIHRLTYRRTNHVNIHVRGYKEEGTTTTPFDMVMLNDLDRFHLVMDVIDRVPSLGSHAAMLRQQMEDERVRARAYTRRRGRRRARDPRLDLAVLRILVVNAGSSSLKLSVLDGDELVWSGSELDELPEVDAVGHRIVHGGTEFVAPVKIDPAVVRRLEALTDLAPLHQPKSLRALELVSRKLPDVPAVACFDTAFHARMPLGRRRRTRCRANGGLAGTCASSASTGCRTSTRRGARSSSRARRRTRASSRAISVRVRRSRPMRDGHSVDTTMGFTPLDGLVMATRSGEIDPGSSCGSRSTWGCRRPSSPRRWNTARAARAHRPPDMKEILEREAAGDETAALAVGVYLHRLRGGIAAMAAALGGLDVLVFTGGVGERAAAIRARAGEDSASSASRSTPTRNEAQPDAEIGGGAVRAFVVTAREDLQIARGVRAVLG